MTRVATSNISLKKQLVKDSDDRFNHIPSAIPFAKQIERETFRINSKPASDERFSYMPPEQDMRFKRSMVSDFSKTKAPCIDEYLLRKELTSENAFNQVYEPKYDYGKKPVTHHIPEFYKYVSRAKLEKIDKMNQFVKPELYDPEKVKNGMNYLSQHRVP